MSPACEAQLGGNVFPGTTINLTSNATIAPPGTLAGAARPMPLINGSSFWAQGVKIGGSYAF